MAVDLDATVAESLERHGVPGAAVGVVDAHGVARVVTAGTRGDGRGPVDDSTVFAAASLSKPVFASGVMALVNAGVLELDRPLSEYVTEPYLAEDERAAAITARMVLSHTTGFPNWRHDGPLFLRWPPGTRWGYSGEGYSYLQQVVEHLVGVGIDRYLADSVLRPLGMHDSSFVWPAMDEPRLALGHSRDGQPRPPFRPPRAKAAAGGLFTTAPDYLRFLVHSLTHNQPMFEAQAKIDDELAWGLGWGIEHGPGGRTIWQWGNDPGYKNFVIGRPTDRQGVVVFTNGDHGASVYTEVVGQLLPGPHPSLERRHRLGWMMAMAARPVDLRTRLDEPNVRSLLKIASGDGGEVEVDPIAGRYADPGTWLLGVVVEKSWEEIAPPPGTPIACIGLEPKGRDEARITALAVLPDWRRQGIATSLIFGACERLGLRALEAETDAGAVGFFRAIGFAAGSLGERHPEAGRLRCRLELPPR
jgi:CubicO group peptidase (beta-lactamase class C family)